MAGTAGRAGTAGSAGTVGAAGTHGSAGASGAAGIAGGQGGGAGNSGGAGGDRGGSGGSGHLGGAGGSAPTPDCSSFPSASPFVTPTDGLTHCYWVHPELLDWNTSQSTCTGQDGYLATILSVQENTFVLGLLTAANLFPAATAPPPGGPFPPPPAPPAVAVSLGATDGKSSTDMTGAGAYAWVTGETWSYTNWQPGQPDGSCNSCGVTTGCGCDHWLAMGADGTWYDRPVSTGRAFVCEATAR
jgi:hypothetical protein